MTLQQSQSPKSSRSCTHIKSTGRRCESPSLRGEQFCYFHQRMHRGVRTPPQARLHPIALIEDEESIQVALMEVMNALLRNTIDLKRATLILRALHIAVKNASRARFEFHGKYSVRDIPQYSEPNQDHVGADAFVRPGPDASVRSAAASVDDDLSIREFDAPPPNEPPQRPRRPRRTRDELYAEYYGYPTVEAFLASPEGKRHYPPAPPQAQVTQDGRAQITANAPQPSVTEVEGKLLKDGKSERQHETKTAPRKPPATVKAPLTAKQKNSLKGART